MNLGVITSGVTQDLEKALQLITADGFKLAELHFAWGLEVGCHTDAQNQEIRSLLDKYKVAVPCLMKNIFASLTVNDAAVDSDRYRQEMEMLVDTIKLARFLGAGAVRCAAFDKHNVVFGSGGAEKLFTKNNQAWGKFLKLMEPACEIIMREKMDLIMETGTGSFIHTAALARKAIDDLKCPRLKVLWDPANCIYSQENVMRGYEAVRDCLGEVHIKDVRVDKPMAKIVCCPVGHGEMGPYLDDLADALKKDGWDGPIVFENQVCPPNHTEEETYHWSVARFKEAFA